MQDFVQASNGKNQGPPETPRSYERCHTSKVRSYRWLGALLQRCDHWLSIPSANLCNALSGRRELFGYPKQTRERRNSLINDTPPFSTCFRTPAVWKVYCADGRSPACWLNAKTCGFWEPPRALRTHQRLPGRRTKPGGLPASSFIEPNYIDPSYHGKGRHAQPSRMRCSCSRSNVNKARSSCIEIYNASRNSRIGKRFCF